MLSKIYDKIKNFLKANYKFLIFFACLIFLFYYEFPFIIYKSGGIIDLQDRIEIDTKYTEEGSLSMSYVTAIKGTAPFILLSYILPDWDLMPLDEVTNEDSYDEVLEIGKEYLNEGIDNAIISAFNASDYNVTITGEKSRVMYLSDEAKTDVKIGDEVYKIDDQEIKNIDDVKAYINTLKEGDSVKIYVHHNNKDYERKAVIYKDTDDTLKIGVAFKTLYEYETEIPVKIKMKNNESGSSGGLMMSLAIYNALTKEDITHGLKIVGTGSINSDGTVEEIGGVKYKVLGAAKKKADIFFCPKENYQEALDVKKKRDLDITIVEVASLNDAINYLNNYAK